MGRGGTALQAGSISGSNPEGLIGVLIDLTLLAQCGPVVDSVSNRNQYQGFVMRGKGGQCVGLQRYNLHVPIV